MARRPARRPQLGLASPPSAAQLVELKSGETYNGVLVSCDTWMNLHLREAICTSKDGDRFWRMAMCYVRGNTIKYLRVPEPVLDKVAEEEAKRREAPPRPAAGGGRGRGRGEGGRTYGRGEGRGRGGGGRGEGRGRGGGEKLPEWA